MGMSKVNKSSLSAKLDASVETESVKSIKITKPATPKAPKETKDVKNFKVKSIVMKSPSRRTFPPNLILKCEMCQRKFALESSLKRHVSMCQLSSPEKPPAKKRKRA